MVFFDIITTLKFLFFFVKYNYAIMTSLMISILCAFFRFRHSSKKMGPKITEKNCITMLIKNLLVVLFSSFHLLLMGGTFQRFTWFLRNITNQSIINFEFLYQYILFWYIVPIFLMRISKCVRASSCTYNWLSDWKCFGTK